MREATFVDSVGTTFHGCTWKGRVVDLRTIVHYLEIILANILTAIWRVEILDSLGINCKFVGIKILSSWVTLFSTYRSSFLAIWTSLLRIARTKIEDIHYRSFVTATVMYFIMLIICYHGIIVMTTYNLRKFLPITSSVKVVCNLILDIKGFYHTMLSSQETCHPTLGIQVVGGPMLGMMEVGRSMLAYFETWGTTLDMQGLEGPMFNMKEMGDPMLAFLEMGMPTLNLGEACFTMLSSSKAWQLGWTSGMTLYALLSGSDGLYDNWSLGRLIYYSLHLGVGAWLLMI